MNFSTAAAATVTKEVHSSFGATSSEEAADHQSHPGQDHKHDGKGDGQHDAVGRFVVAAVVDDAIGCS